MLTYLDAELRTMLNRYYFLSSLTYNSKSSQIKRGNYRPTICICCINHVKLYITAVFI